MHLLGLSVCLCFFLWVPRVGMLSVTFHGHIYSFYLYFPNISTGIAVLMFLKIRKTAIDQESIQSSTTPVQGYQMGK